MCSTGHILYNANYNHLSTYKYMVKVMYLSHQIVGIGRHVHIRMPGRSVHIHYDCASKQLNDTLHSLGSYRRYNEVRQFLSSLAKYQNYEMITGTGIFLLNSS